ncbi:MAG: hypothetical protein Q9M20_00130 [Mariprofundaceae bacterium]|nr:hypothetical protein [Mariprofundaceae bacterium]
MRKLLLLIALFISMPANAVILPGYVDTGGNPVHTRDEVDVQVAVVVQPVPQGYRYTYTLTSMQSSKQNIDFFAIYLPDPYSSVVPVLEGSPWPKSKGGFPNNPVQTNILGQAYPPELWYIGWVPVDDFNEIQPGNTIAGFTFVSPYPPGSAEGYVEGWSYGPVTPEDGPGAPEFYQRSKYGEGKVVPVIGPVKPATPNVTDSYSLIACTGGLCDVQLDITGPQDPYGTAYTYTWSGAFGTATGAKPIVQLAAGTYTVSVAVSDPYATLVTATMPITVVGSTPTPTVPILGNITPAQAAALTPAQLKALTPTQLTSAVSLLTPTQLTSLTPSQLTGLTPVQINSISAWLTPTQLLAIQGIEDEHDKHDDENDDSDSDEEDSKDKGDE